ncbi:hypothetical protein RG959_24570, partial [Domibacillus sp. 8LH]
IEREEEDLLTARLDHGPHAALGGGVAVAHAEIDHDAVAVETADLGGDGGCLILGDRHERALALVMVPDQLVVGARREGALGQDQ